MAKVAVLAVDDSSDDTLLLRKACQRSKACFDLFVVQDGVEAVHYLSGSEPYVDRLRYPIPALLLLDLKMPRMNGFEALEWVRAQPGLKNVPVIVFTASQHDSDVRNAYDKGANGYIVKPVDYDDLVKLTEAISSAIGQHQDVQHTLSQSPYFRCSL